MLKDTDELEIGQQLYLYPQTKAAGVECYRYLAVTLIERQKAYWPRLHVEWTEKGADRPTTRLIHKDNIRLKPPEKATAKKEGDAVSDHGEVHAQPRVLTTNKPKPIVLPDNMEQGELF